MNVVMSREFAFKSNSGNEVGERRFIVVAVVRWANEADCLRVEINTKADGAGILGLLEYQYQFRHSIGGFLPFELLVVLHLLLTLLLQV
jgi:hypothetical protein